jgi:hypothetical protein
LPRATTGYTLYLNADYAGATTGTSYTFTGMRCDATFHLGVQAHDSASDVSPTYTTTYTTPPCGTNGPMAMSAPAVTDTTLLNNYEEPDAVESSAGSWNGCGAANPCTYTYQFQDCSGLAGTTGTACTDIDAARCSATTATTCSYPLRARDVGDYVVSLVTAANGAGKSAPAASKAVGPVVASRVNKFCNIAAAYNQLSTGPHLCGWPDSTNVGYVNAPGFPGGLTTASSRSPTCPTTPHSNHVYSFCKYVDGLSLPTNLTNVTFYGDEFQSNAVGNANVHAGSGDSDITFNYDTFQPEAAAPPVTCSQSYQYGIYNESAAMTSYTVAHSDFWGFADAIDTNGSTEAAPQIFRYNWFHDASDAGPCTGSGGPYHIDGIGAESGTAKMAGTVADHNTIELVGNTNGIAWQNGSYTHDQNTNNLLSGDNETYAGARCTSGCTPPTYIETTGNTFNTYLPIDYYPIDGATHYWLSPGSTWKHNFWAVPSGAAWGTAAYNGYYWVPTGNSNYPHDCGFVSQTDYPDDTNPCS